MTLQEMQEIDIRTVDINTLVDISTVKVDMNLPKEERMLSVLNQMNGNPYFFRSGNIAVKVSYTDTDRTVDDCIKSYLRTL